MEKAPSTSLRAVEANLLGYVTLPRHGRLDVEAETIWQRGFYIALTLIPVSMVAWVYASSSDSPALTRLITAFHEPATERDRRNTLHQAAVEQAAQDRHLFHTEQQSYVYEDLRFPE